MIYIEPWELLYLPIPKCACTSIKQSICDQINIKTTYEDEVHKKNFLHPLENIIYCKNKEINYLDKKPNVNYKSFIVVRNPIDRIISCYLNKVIYKKSGLQSEYTQAESFEEFISICVSEKFPNIHTKPMCNFITNTEIDFIIKLERIKCDWKKMFEIIKKPTPYLYHQNKSIHKNINISKKTIKKILDFYEKDFLFFNYKKNIRFL